MRRVKVRPLLRAYESSRTHMGMTLTHAASANPLISISIAMFLPSLLQGSFSPQMGLSRVGPYDDSGTFDGGSASCWIGLLFCSFGKVKNFSLKILKATWKSGSILSRAKLLVKVA